MGCILGNFLAICGEEKAVWWQCGGSVSIFRDLRARFWREKRGKF